MSPRTLAITHVRRHEKRLASKSSLPRSRQRNNRESSFEILVNSYSDPTHSSAAAQKRRAPAGAGIHISRAATKALAGIVLLAGNLPMQQRLKAATVLSRLDIRAQTTCETEMLERMGAREVVSGKAHDVLSEV